MTALPIPAKAMEPKAPSPVPAGQVIAFPERPHRRWMRFEEALSMGVGYLALAGFLSGLGYLFVA